MDRRRRFGGSTRRPTPSRPDPPRRGRRWNGAKLAATAFGLLIVCSLIAGAVGTAVFDRGSDADDDPSVGDGPGDYESSLRAAIEDDPEDVVAMRSLAALLVTEREVREAISWYERAVDLEPTNLQLRLDFSSALIAAGAMADAEVQYEKALVIDPNSVDAFFYRAEMYRLWEPERTAEAISDYRRVVELDADSFHGEQALGELGRLGVVTGTPVATPVGVGAGGYGDDQEQRGRGRETRTW